MPDEEHIVPAIREERAPRLRAAGELARQQHGVVRRAQLLGLGLSSSGIGRLLDVGWLQPVDRGVYAVGRRALEHRGRWTAGVLAAGPHAALSFRSAGGLHEIRPAIARVDVTAPTRRRSRPGLVVHRAVLAADEVTVVDGIRVTTVGRTLLDLAGTESEHLVERAANEAEARGLGDALPPAVLLDRHAGHPGVARLRRILADPALGAELTESELEERFRAFLAGTDFPRPRWAHQIGEHRCDCVWIDERVIVELDSRRWHATRTAFENDRARDRILQAAGWHIIRITWRQLEHHARELERDLRALLGRSP